MVVCCTVSLKIRVPHGEAILINEDDEWTGFSMGARADTVSSAILHLTGMFINLY